MGQNPSKPPGGSGGGHHQPSHSRSRNSSSNHPSSQTTPSSVSRTASQRRRDGRGATPAASRSTAVPPSETLVSATATPQRIPQRPVGVGTPASVTGGISPAHAMAAVVASSPVPTGSPGARLRSPALPEDAAQQQYVLPARSSPMAAGPRAKSPSPPPDDRPPTLQQLPGFEYRPSVSGINRPPRLPLPVGEEVHTPGSPILSPTDLRGSVPDSELDEDEPTSEMGMYQLDSGGLITIPTLIEWKEPGEKVFVTGTFAGWSKKFKLLPDPDRHSLSAIIQLPPGTHHLKFIVDGEMQTAKHLPVAVDFTNILLNYLEVSADDVPATRSSATKMSAPPQTSPPKAAPLPQQTQQPQPAQQAQQTQQPLPIPPTQQPQHVGSPVLQGTPDQKPGGPPKLTLSGPARPRKFDTNIPTYLRGLESSDNLSANMSAGGYDIPDISKDTPAPSLPIMLSKVILNSSTPIKDDSSVLNIPNHVVLNHLATSSIRFGCLASSGTTRYRRKYVTTIMYKPLREEAGESSGGVAGSAVPQSSAPTAQAAS